MTAQGRRRLWIVIAAVAAVILCEQVVRRAVQSCAESCGGNVAVVLPVSYVCVCLSK